MSKYGGVSADLAAVDGRRRFNMDKVMTVVCVILLLIIVSVMQTAGSTLAARTTNRALFRKGGNTK